MVNYNPGEHFGFEMYRILSMVTIATVLMFLLAIVAGCGVAMSTTPPTDPAPRVNLRLEPVLHGFERWLAAPTNFVQAADGRILVTHQEGLISTFNEEDLGAEHIFVPGPLDIRDRVNDKGWEEGLAGAGAVPGK